MLWDVFETAHDLRQRKTMQANLAILSVFQQLEQTFSNPLCPSYFTEAVPLKLLLPSCYQVKEEVDSK